MIEVTKESLAQDVFMPDELTLVLYYADGCKPCALMKNTLLSLEIDFLDFVFCMMPANQSGLDIPGAPTTIVYKGDTKIGMLAGAKDVATTNRFLKEMMLV